MIAQEMAKDADTATRMRDCLQALGGYRDWDAEPALCQSLRDFAANLDERRRPARLGLCEVDAALGDPRWLAKQPAITLPIQ